MHVCVCKYVYMKCTIYTGLINMTGSTCYVAKFLWKPKMFVYFYAGARTYVYKVEHKESTMSLLIVLQRGLLTEK